MYYALIGIVGLITLVIINNDIFFHLRTSHNTKFINSYRGFLYIIALYYVSDILWGVFWNKQFYSPLYVDTEFYFILMAAGIMYLAKYTVDYLEEKTKFKYILLGVSALFFVFVVVIMTVNIFNPIMFTLDQACNFYSLPFRYTVLGLQVMLFLVIAIYTTIRARLTGGLKAKKYITIASFAIIVATAISVQMFYPLYPFYGIGYMIGSCLLRTFIIETEREEYRLDLELSLDREKEQSKQLKAAWDLAYTDALTGVGSKLSYLEIEDKYDNLINEKKLQNFAIAVFDINNLKQVNDTLGHQAGDKYIVDACMLIKNTFNHSQIFRIGGDEFIVLLDEEDYKKRDNLVRRFNKQIEENISSNNVVVAIGLAEYLSDEDYSFGRIVNRADSAMYERKKELKRL